MKKPDTIKEILTDLLETVCLIPLFCVTCRSAYEPYHVWYRHRYQSASDPDTFRLNKMEMLCEHGHGRRMPDGTYQTRKSWEVFTDFEDGPLTLREAIDNFGEGEE